MREGPATRGNSRRSRKVQIRTISKNYLANLFSFLRSQLEKMMIWSLYKKIDLTTEINKSRTQYAQIQRQLSSSGECSMSEVANNQQGSNQEARNIHETAKEMIIWSGSKQGSVHVERIEKGVRKQLRHWIALKGNLFTWHVDVEYGKSRRTPYDPPLLYPHTTPLWYDLNPSHLLALPDHLHWQSIVTHLTLMMN